MFVRCFLCRLSFLIVFGCLGQLVAAQSNFLYIQSENNQPYYIQLKGNVYSSNAKGYLLIPQMRDGEYSMVLGFPVKEYKESTFNFTIVGKPKGYSLKFTQEGEWMMMDMVTLELLKGMPPENPITAPVKERQVQKISEKQTEGGLEQVYKVKNGAKAEEIIIVIPEAKVQGITREALVSPAMKAAQKKTTKQ